MRLAHNAHNAYAYPWAACMFTIRMAYASDKPLLVEAVRKSGIGVRAARESDAQAAPQPRGEVAADSAGGGAATTGDGAVVQPGQRENPRAHGSALPPTVATRIAPASAARSAVSGRDSAASTQIPTNVSVSTATVRAWATSAALTGTMADPAPRQKATAHTVTPHVGPYAVETVRIRR